MKNFIIFLLLAGGLMAQRPAIFGPTSGGGGSGDVVGPASSTDNAVALFDGTTGKLLKNSDITYSGTTLSVPDAFGITSAGSIDLTAGGSSKNIKATNATGGNFILTQNSGTLPTQVFQGLQLVGTNATQTVYAVDSIGSNSRFIGRRANGTAGSLSAVQSGEAITLLSSGGYGATGYSSARASITFTATENWTDSAAGQKITFAGILTGTNTGYAGISIDGDGRLVVSSGGAKTRAAWGTFGTVASFNANEAGTGLTFTDSSSSGTVATTTVFNSFAVPTLNSTSAASFSGVLANVHIAGDPLVTGNASLTGVSYGLNNEGKTRLVGAALITGGSLTLGTAGTSAAALAFLNATSGSITVAPPTGALGTRTQTLQAVTDTFVYRDTTDTLTNKRITARIATLTDAATVTPATDSYDGGILTTLSQATQIANPTGTPTEGQRYTIRIKSTTARALTYGSQFRGSTDLALPSTTSGGSLTDYMIFSWNVADSKWDLLGKTFGF